MLYNTYWVRFNHKMFTHADAVQNTLVLFKAAKAAGVERIVHVSITNPSEESPLEYFRGKAQLERALKELGIPYAILRPTVLFGKGERALPLLHSHCQQINIIADRLFGPILEIFNQAGANRFGGMAHHRLEKTQQAANSQLPAAHAFRFRNAVRVENQFVAGVNLYGCLFELFERHMIETDDRIL